MDNFAKELKKARARTGLSQQGMADRMLIPKRTIQKWEIAAATPPPYVQRFVLNELEMLGSGIIGEENTLVYCRKKAKETETACAPLPRGYKLPLGYKLQDGVVLVDDEEAEVVKRAINEMASDGWLNPETEKELRQLWVQHYKK